MTQARSTLVDLSTTPYYHCMSRCVQRALLCGRDDRDGKDYDHRKDWVVERLQLLAEISAIRILSFSAMSNHLHVLIQVDDGQAKRWAERDVIERWGKLYPGSFAAATIQNAPLTPVQKDYVLKCVPKWREGLYSVSWFMRSLNEWSAKAAPTKKTSAAAVSGRVGLKAKPCWMKPRS